MGIAFLGWTVRFPGEAGVGNRKGGKRAPDGIAVGNGAGF